MEHLYFYILISLLTLRQQLQMQLFRKIHNTFHKKWDRQNKHCPISLSLLFTFILFYTFLPPLCKNTLESIESEGKYIQYILFSIIHIDNTSNFSFFQSKFSNSLFGHLKGISLFIIFDSSISSNCFVSVTNHII